MTGPSFSVFAVAALPFVDAADGLLLLNAANFTLRHEPALIAQLAQQPAAHHLLLETLEKLLLRFVRSQGHRRHGQSPPRRIEVTRAAPESQGPGPRQQSDARWAPAVIW